MIVFRGVYYTCHLFAKKTHDCVSSMAPVNDENQGLIELESWIYRTPIKGASLNLS